MSSYYLPQKCGLICASCIRCSQQQKQRAWLLVTTYRFQMSSLPWPSIITYTLLLSAHITPRERLSPQNFSGKPISSSDSRLSGILLIPRLFPDFSSNKPCHHGKRSSSFGSSLLSGYPWRCSCTKRRCETIVSSCSSCRLLRRYHRITRSRRV